MKHRFKSKSSKRLLPLAFVLGGSCIWGNSIAMETHSLRMEKNVAEQSQRSVVGKVVDETGESLPGVTVLVEGSSRGVITDVDGTFTINVSDADKLVISYIGMQTEVIPIEKKKKIFVTLKAKVDELDEVTVVAFAKQKKESVIASVSTVKPSELKVPSSNLTTALAGRMSGIISYQRSGEPGQDNADFFIRGVTTFGTGKANPLILIDGVEFTSQDLARLNTDDIASFSIMKDANATALYGARGANGVILVTTKEGAEGKAKLSVRYEHSISGPADEVDLADPITYMELHNEAVRTRDPLGLLPYSNEKIANTKRGLNPFVYPANDWRELMFKDFTTNQRLNLNISGGGSVARYYVAASYSSDNGILKDDTRNNFKNNIDLKKYVLRANVNINLTKSTEMIVRLHGTFDDYTGPLDGGSGLYTKVMRTNPVLFPAYYLPDEANKNTQHILFGNYDTGNYVNPYADMVRGYKDYSNTVVLAQLELRQNLDFLTKGLSARVLFNTSRTSYFDVSRYYTPFYYNVADYDRATDTYQLVALNSEGGKEYLEYSEGAKQVSSTTYLEAAVQYNRTFNDKHNLSGLLVYTMREALYGNAGDLLRSLPYRNLGLAGRFTYAYDNRYFLEANFGYNGSERFSKKERFGFFPSIGIGYLISNEEFWKPLSNVISKLKLKATYGMVGNDAIGSDSDRFFYLSNVNLDNGNMGYAFGTDFGYWRNGVSISRYEDPLITWETAYKQNYGIELGLYNKLEIQADYFRENRKKILQNRISIPSTMGLQASPQANIGESFASGVDISVDYSHSFNKDLWLSVRGNFTYATSEYKVFEEPDYSDTPWRSYIGTSLSQGRGLIAERLFVDEDDVRNSPKQMFGEYGAGDIKYKDINMDGMIDGKDYVPIGYPHNPEIIYGAGFSFGYKGLDFSAFFQGSARSSIWLDVANITPFIDTDKDPNISSQNALLQVIADSHWSEDNRNPYAFWPRLSDHALSNNAQWSTWYMYNGAFLRLKTMELGYTLPQKWTKKVHMESLRIYLSGTNLLTFSKFKLWDPEMGNGLGYPIQRVFNIGINVNF
ncbi:SusC/RagA family TonB-linked outer membrane protein [Phocaeicola plebeius]|uniref:SusC/RagA family TonB-linked outer membrane protein n=1 Tax=Phocaeicola plebeius TaxID=310297 RepID=UPI0039C5DA60